MFVGLVPAAAYEVWIQLVLHAGKLLSRYLALIRDKIYVLLCTAESLQGFFVKAIKSVVILIQTLTTVYLFRFRFFKGIAVGVFPGVSVSVYITDKI